LIIYFVVRPEVQLRIDKTNVSVGDRVTIECKQRHQGRPKAKISWYHNDKIVPEKEETYFFRDEEIKLNDAGTYKCKAENDAGESKSEVRRITVNKKPDDKGEKGWKL
jgi:membrane carboxypeptidase/penicillin-binding protein PbpC